MSYAYIGDFPNDGDGPHDSMPDDAFCDERCFWCGERPEPTEPDHTNGSNHG